MSRSSHGNAEKKSTPIKCVVVSDKMERSRVAVQERRVKHARYGKYITRRSRYMFHDAGNESKVGDTVYIVPSKPYSKNKKFTLQSIQRLDK